MTKSTAHIDAETFRNITSDVLQDSNISLPSGGYSMFPVLMPGDELIVSKRALQDIRKGDIVVVAYSSKTVGHRVVAIRNKEVVTRGDNCKSNDPVVSCENIVGVVVSYVRNNSEYSLQLFRFACMRFLLLYCSVITRLGIRAMFVAYRIRKACSKSYSTLRNQLQLILQHSQHLFWKYIAISVLQACMPFVLVVCVKLLIDTIMQSDNSVLHSQVYVVLAIVAGSLLLTRVLYSVAAYIREQLSHSISQHIHLLLHEKHSRLDFSHLEQSHMQDVIHRANMEAEHRPQRLVQQLAMLVKAVVSSVVVFVFMASIFWAAVPLLLLGLLPSIIVRIRQSKQLYALQNDQKTTERKLSYVNRILTAIPFAKELRLFSTANFFSHMYMQNSKVLFSEKKVILKRIMRSEIGCYAFAVIVVFGVLLYTVQLGMQGLVSVGTVVLFFLVLQRGFSAFNELFHTLAAVYQDSLFFQDFVGFLALSEVCNANEHIQIQLHAAPSIELRNVSFTYPMSTRTALNDVSLQIPAGKTIALVGENGSGKTTLIKLLCGFYPTQSGAITVNGIDISRIEIAQLRKNISAVFQDFALYNMTVAENIHLGNIQQPLNVQGLEQALIDSACMHDISQLPHGANTLLGNLFAQGEELSIGQWQKIAIARALYRNAPIVILDEPSSALDAMSEQTIIQSLQTLLQGKTGIIISHTFSTIQWVDHIYVMKHGRIIESGTHNELLANKGEYWQMYMLQKG